MQDGALPRDESAALKEMAGQRLTPLPLRGRDYVFPGVPVLEASAQVAGLEAALSSALAVGGKRVGTGDLEFGVRQLADVGVRALSPGINDPQTASAVLDRFGAVLCEMAPRHLPTGVCEREGAAVFSRPAVTYDGLVDAMFNALRQNAERSPSVLIRLVEVLTAVARADRDPLRRATLRRHADLAMTAAERGGIEPAAVADLRRRRCGFDDACAAPGALVRP